MPALHATLLHAASLSDLFSPGISVTVSHGGEKVLRDQSPMSFSAAYQRVLRSTQEVDVSFVSAACILFHNSSLGIAIQEIFMQAGLPWRHACVASFYLCELRKYFSRTAHKYRAAFATAASRLGTPMTLWCDTAGWDGEYVNNCLD